MHPRHNVAKEDPDHNLYKRGEVYWCRYVLGGTEHRVSLRTVNVAAARKERNKLLKAADDRRDGKPIARVHIWEDAVSVFLVNVLDVGKKYSPSTAKRYQVSLRQLGPVLEGTPLEEITTGTVSDYVKARQQEGASVSTIRNDLTAWSMVMSFAASERMVEGNQLRAYEREWLGEDEDALDPPLDAEAAEMVREVSEWSRDMADLMVWLRETGMRLGEALHAMAEDIHPDQLAITLSRGVKGNRRSGKKTRTIQLGRAAALLDRLPRKGRLFARLSIDSAVVSTRYGQWKRQRQAREAKAAKAAGRVEVTLRIFRLHDLRHAFAIASVIDAPNRIVELQKHLGHASVKTTETYTRFLDQHAIRHHSRNAALFGSLPEAPVRTSARAA